MNHPMMCSWRNRVCALFLFTLILITDGFNLNWRDAFVFRDPQGQMGSYFGFSVALRHQGATHWLVVGAPRGNSTYFKHMYLHQPGIVYQCGLRKGGDCMQLVVDTSGNLCVMMYVRTLQSSKSLGWQ
ncbi:integrin alpha-4-like [Zootermopsis nevadensis]|uniref:integrin alpha-4-like n=1 Tax=Zootermopsis nevadensis TaxID=136037 RepID=UPI000B8E2642|nr:integrin alpha-4-like [Zootermopsis nevadensis]